MNGIKKRKTLQRPVALIGFVYLLSLAAANFLPLLFAASVFLGLLILVLIFSFIKPLRSQKLLLPLLAATVAFGSFSVYTHFNYKPAVKLDGKTVYITGKVIDITVSSSGKAVVVTELDPGVTSTVLPVKMNLYLDEPIDAKIEDRISGMVRCALPSEEFGTHSPLSSAKADGVYLYGFGTGTDFKTEKVEGLLISRKFSDAKKALTEKADELFEPKTASVFKAMLLGDKSKIDSDTYRDFTRTGILHVIVVSGLHLVILTQFLLRTMKALYIKRRPRYAIAMAVIPLMMGVVGFTPSICRSGFMLLLVYTAKLLKRDSDSLTSLALSGLIFTLFSPYLVTDVSFLLTYLSTLGIILLSKRISNAIVVKLRLKHPFWLWSIDLLAVSVAASAATIPVTAFLFRGLPILSPLINILLSPFFTVILSLGFLVLTLSFFSGLPFFSFLLFLLTKLVSAAVSCVCIVAHWGSSIPFSYLPMGYRFVYLAVIASMLLFAATGLFFRFRHRYKIAALLSAGIILLSSGCHFIAYRNVLTLGVCTVGKDSAVVMKYRDQMILLGSNSLSHEVGEETFVSKIPFAYADTGLEYLATSSQYLDMGVIYTNNVIPKGSIKCGEVRSTENCSLYFPFPAEMEMHVIDEKTYLTVKYGEVNIVYGSYDKNFESFYQEGKINIYILVKDCNPHFQKPANYAIMLKGVGKESQKQNPNTRFIDGSKQGITPFHIRDNGNIAAEGAGKWLY